MTAPRPHSLFKTMTRWGAAGFLVTAATLGKTCVVNCDDMVVFEKDKRCVINGTVFSSCDPIAIDGHKGIVYQGNYPIKIQEL